MAILPTLRQPDCNLVFELHTDAASKKGIAVILCLRVEKAPYPLSFESRSLSTTEQNYSVQEMEALAIVWGIKNFRPFLEFGHFTVLTDHSPLCGCFKPKTRKKEDLPVGLLNYKDTRSSFNMFPERQLRRRHAIQKPTSICCSYHLSRYEHQLGNRTS